MEIVELGFPGELLQVGVASRGEMLGSLRDPFLNVRHIDAHHRLCLNVGCTAAQAVSVHLQHFTRAPVSDCLTFGVELGNRRRRGPADADDGAGDPARCSLIARPELCMDRRCLVTICHEDYPGFFSQVFHDR